MSRAAASSRHVLITFAAICLLAPTTAAQQADTTRLAPVVVTASRTTAPQMTSTVATTVLLGEALRARGITTVAAALREVPGVTVAQTAGRGSQTSLFLRGGEADYVQVMIDGVTVNEPGGAFNFATLALDNVDRIEVVRGPTSVLYGANAVAGVIQIFTRGGGEGTSTELLARAGGRGLVDVEGSAGHGGAGRAAWWIGGGHHRSDGIHDLNNDWRSSTASGRIRLVPRASSALNVTTRYSDARYDYPTEYHGAPLDSNSYTTDRRLSIGADLIQSVRPDMDLRFGIGLSRSQSITNDPLDDRTDSFDDGSAIPFEARSLRRSAEAQLDLRVVPGGTLTVGGEYDWQELEAAGETPGTDPLLERWSRGVFAQLLGDAGMRISYSLGARAEENERYGSLSSVRAGAALRVTASMSLRLSMGTAFKEPQFLEITGGGFALPNPGLRPERSRSWEIGAEQRFAADRLSLGATYFDQSFTDMIVYTPTPPSQGYSARYTNAQAADASGWEFEARVATTNGISARASYSVLDGDVRASSTSPAAPLPRRASRTAAVTIAVPVGDRLRLAGDYSYTGARHDVRFFPSDPFSRAERLPAYDLLGVGATYALHPRRVFRAELMARVDNVLDERYEAVAGFATERRTASFGVRIGIAP